MSNEHVSLIKATNEHHIRTIASLASHIWREHYTSIIGSNQVEYMLDKFQNEKAIEGQIADGFNYYIISSEQEAQGYLSIAEKEKGLFLSKIYIERKQRGKGLGKIAMKFVFDAAKELKLKKVWLTVNKNNHKSIEAYEKMGFIKAGALVMDIGGGFVMDDYRMEKELPINSTLNTG